MRGDISVTQPSTAFVAKRDPIEKNLSRGVVDWCAWIELRPLETYAGKGVCQVEQVQFNGGQIMDFGGCKSWSHRLCLIS
jgi:hypothetical protein